MANIKLAISALLTEIAAWSSLRMLHEHADNALLTYLVAHALASTLFAFCLMPLISVPRGLSQQRLTLVALIALVSFAIPIVGMLGCVAALLALRRSHGRDMGRKFPSMQLPEFDQHQLNSNSRRQTGLRTFLSNPAAPVASRMRAMVALNNVSGRIASPMLRTALTDSSDDLRLLAYSMLDSKEQQISQTIHSEQQALQQAIEAEGPSPLGPRGVQAAWALSDLYWEMIYQGIAQSDVREHAIFQSLHYCLMALEQRPKNALLHLRKGRLMQLTQDYTQAQNAYEMALALGLAPTRVIPYQAEIHFLQHNYSQVQKLMHTLDATQAQPRLRPSIQYWSAA
ncbi:hypothetical protein [Comamonas aquatilis]|uniref:hypothetical protein n=1 Tax=Comamonas aquatilis TaxID=1778406 RepID=UPI0039EEAD44